MFKEFYPSISLGTFEHAMGTNVFFAENPSPPPMDPNFESIPSTMYKFVSQTNKVLKMERIFISPKKDNEEEELTNTLDDEDDVPNESYADALNHFLSPGELPPRTLTGADVIKPVEFQSFFRPQLETVTSEQPDEQSDIIDEEANASMATNDNSTTKDTSQLDAVESGSMEVNIKREKIETVNQEQQ